MYGSPTDPFHNHNKYIKNAWKNDCVPCKRKKTHPKLALMLNHANCSQKVLLMQIHLILNAHPINNCQYNDSHQSSWWMLAIVCSKSKREQEREKKPQNNWLVNYVRRLVIWLAREHPKTKAKPKPKPKAKTMTSEYLFIVNIRLKIRHYYALSSIFYS